MSTENHVPTLVWCLVSMSLVWSGCVDPLATGDYKGDPLMRIEGRIFLSADQHNEPWLASANLRVALFWTGALSEDSLYDEKEGRIVEQPAVTRGVFPARYAMSLFLPPTQGAVRAHAGGEGELGVALVLLYWDTNANGVWDRNRESLAGGTGDFVLIYTPNGASGGNLEADLDPGYHLMHLNKRTESCQGAESGRLTLRRASLESKVNLTITREVGSVMPDADCNGFIDTCQDFVERARSTNDDDEQARLLAEYRACVHDLWDDSPYLAEEACFSLLDQVDRENGEVSEEIRDVYELCLEELGGPEAGLVCDGFLAFADFCDFNGEEDCTDAFLFAFDLCLQHDRDGSGQCGQFFEDFERAESPAELGEEFWPEFANCLLETEEGPDLVEFCVEEEEARCEMLLDEFDRDPEGITDTEWSIYDRCIENIFELCLPDDPCGEALDFFPDCQGERECEESLQSAYDVCSCEVEVFTRGDEDCEALAACADFCLFDDEDCREDVAEDVAECHEFHEGPGPPIDPDFDGLPDECADICLAAIDAPDEKARREALEAFEQCLRFNDLGSDHECTIPE